MNNDTGKRLLTLREAYRLALMIADKEAGLLKRILLLFALSFFAQGCAYLCFYPLLQALFASPPDLRAAGWWLVAMAVLGALDLCCRWLAHNFDYTGAIVDVTHRLREKLGDRLRRMPLEALSGHRIGDLNATLSLCVDNAVLHMGVVASLILQTLVVPTVVIVGTLWADWRLSLVLVLLFPLAVPIYRWRRRSSHEEKREVTRAYADVESDSIEYIQGLPVLRAVNQVGEKSGRMQASIASLRAAQANGLIEATLPALLISTLVELGLLTVLALGTYRVLGGTCTVPVLAALLVMISRLSEPLTIFVNVTTVLDVVESSFARIRELLAIEDLPVLPAAGQPDRYSVTFEQVDFAYKGQESRTLAQVSFSLPPNSLTALVGPSGSGKTTVAKLIMRYADPQSGLVRIGNCDLRTLQQETLMNCLSVVFQDVYLFDDTIFNNIRMGRPEASDSEVEAAARAAYCHDFIDQLPQGYQTRIGDIGGTLSGGERQRISIARAMLKNAPIVILDEPTASLDTESEVEVQRAIDTLVRNRTVIVIAHRLSTIMKAESILVIDDGRLVEQGTHAQLLAQQGRYCQMWEVQQRAKQWSLHKARA
ncbi:MAG: ABC transporter ATP-binding protein/permease [Desulfobulbus sp.]|jgi:ATP-binding cassette subfamily B protein|uniref:ABC transporter ATP-binding protein n=1 Tax=Desulfobulbus sp. TaxID=895 RepID=UPI0028517B3B|nr:ABC transporter ATP-binding protein [Desulfobulbus sp.]MDR2549237.1 ABC transporter ATP-binding protein/permease [Desulfobulbus sp.]